MNGSKATEKTGDEMSSCWDVGPSLSKALRKKSCKPAFNAVVENDVRQWPLARWDE